MATEGSGRRAAAKDCLSCRVIGTGACLGSSAYIAFHTQGARGFHKGIGIFASVGLVAMGAIRAFMA